MAAVRAGVDTAEEKRYLSYAENVCVDQFDYISADMRKIIAEIHCELKAERVERSTSSEDEQPNSDIYGRYLRTVAPQSAGEPGFVRVTPVLKPVWLEVASPAHGHVRACGVGRYFPAHTIHAERSTAVVDANNCRLQATDHYHIHRVTVSFDALYKDGPARRAFDLLLERPADTDRIRAFQRALHESVRCGPDGPTQDRVRVAPRHDTVVVDANGLQTGDGSRMNVVTRYIVEESELSLAALLARDLDLVTQFVDVLTISSDASMRRFLEGMAHAANRLPDIKLINNAAGLPMRETLLASLFGVASVSEANAVMIGSGNKLTTKMRVKHAALDRPDLRTEVTEFKARLKPRDTHQSSLSLPGPPPTVTRDCTLDFPHLEIGL